jgi:uncharacterized protein (DUF885 family)
VNAVHRFDQLVETFYSAWFRFHPQAAVAAGVYAFAGRLPSLDDDDNGALIALLDKAMVALDELDETQLDADRKLDFDLLRGIVAVEHAELTLFDWRHRDPVRLLPIDAVYQLTIRPVPEFETALLAVLEAIPDYLRAARVQLLTAPEQIPAPWLVAAVDEASAGHDYLHELPRLAEISRRINDRSRLVAAAEVAARSVGDFARFLQSELQPRADGPVAVGADHYQLLLAYRHGMGIDAEALEQFGERLVAETRQTLAEAAVALTGEADIAKAQAKVGADHPPGNELVALYRTTMQRAQQFLRENDLVALPDTEELRVIETPRFLRAQIPFAAYQDPAPNDADQLGYYYVTPTAGVDGAAEHNRTAIMHTSVHEAFPGHHLQFVTANQTDGAHSLPRLLGASATLYEGWALYCEQLMHEQGFLSRPESQFVLLRDRLWRGLRVLIDVRMQRGDLDFDGAVSCLQQELGFSRAQAEGEVTWYSRAPAVPMGYAAGWAMINALRDVEREADADFSLRRFHDRLLACGSAPLSLVIAAQFGEEKSERVTRIVFGAE